MENLEKHATVKATVLSDNRANPGLGAEWGLSVFTEYGSHALLLDTGATGLFLFNAKKLGISVERAECAVISHAHYDHAGGLPILFKQIPGIQAYLRAPTGEYCYHVRRRFFRAYIGLPRRLLKRYADRIILASGDVELFPGAYLIPHKTEGLEKCGIREKMYIRKGCKWEPDNFAHEQSLVLDTEKGLVIFNSCCHGGVATIIEEVLKTFPGKTVYAIVGGFHLYNKTEEEVRALADSIRKTGIGRIYTGHCTKEKGYTLLKEELGDILHNFYAGCEMEF